jgi:hypothetical protein
VLESSGTGTTFTIAPGGAGTTMHDLDIRGTGLDTSALEADGAVTVTNVDLAATGDCARLSAPTPSQLGPGVTAITTQRDTSGHRCVLAGGSAADIVTAVSIRAPDTVGVVLGSHGMLTDATVNAKIALDLVAGTVRSSTLNGTAVGVEALSGLFTKAPLVSDSVVTSTADNGTAVLAPPLNMFPVAVKLRNVTAIASGRDSTGLEAQAQVNFSSTADSIDARNVIVRGTSRDVFGEPAAASSGCNGPCASGQVTIGYSNFVSAAGVLDTTIGHNQSADPLLVNPSLGAGQDFHIASASSPLIGAGTPDPSNGPSDRDGVAHPNPPTIGAYEYPVSPSAPPGTSPSGLGVSTTITSPGGASTRPTISMLAETNAVFAVARLSTPLEGRTAAAAPRRGTVFSFRLDQPATVTIVITTNAMCRRTPAGKPRTVRCFRTVARLTRSTHAGANKLPFSGRIRGRPLKPSRYRAAFVATSVGGSSAPKALRFRIVRAPHPGGITGARARGAGGRFAALPESDEHSKG